VDSKTIMRNEDFIGMGLSTLQAKDKPGLKTVLRLQPSSSTKPLSQTSSRGVGAVNGHLPAKTTTSEFCISFFDLFL
jgi:hypothetical protein